MIIKKLEGNKKQGPTASVVWAEKIREEKLTEIKETNLRALTKKADPERYAENEKAIERLQNIPSSKWWIERRYESVNLIMKDARADRLDRCCVVDTQGNYWQ